MSKGNVTQLHAWRNQLRKRGERYVGDERGVSIALQTNSEFSQMLRFNEFSGVTEFAAKPTWRDVAPGDRWTDADDTQLMIELQWLDIDVRAKSVVADAVEVVARKSAYHPVRDYLKGLTWDQTPRLQLWLAEYLNAEGPADYLAAVGKRFMVSAVARVMQPGCQADHVITLEGDQGAGKSRTVQILGGEFTTDSLPDLHSKDAAVQLCGVWLVELAELAALRRTSDVEAAKAFITRRVDRYRPPYGRRTVDIARQCVFIATTNEAQYLRDSTGNRRFWPVRCGKVALEALQRDRDQLWAEAVHLYHAGEQWHLTPEEAPLATLEQTQRQLVTELEQQVGEFLDRLTRDGTTEVDMRRVLVDGLYLEPDKPDYVLTAGRLGPQVAAAMHRHGWHRVGVVGRGRSRKVMYRCTHRESHGEIAEHSYARART